jgi:hypothetical protein
MRHSVTHIYNFEHRESIKESWPRGPGFDFTPEVWRLPLDNQWNNGMVEKWNIGYEKRIVS